MIDNCLLDKRIKDALKYDENKLPMDFGPLEKAKHRLQEDSLFDCKINMSSLVNKRKMRVSFVFMLVFLALGGLLGVSASNFIKVDRIDYPFVDDPQVIGKWKCVDFVKYVNEFVPGQRQWYDLYLKEFAFIKDGKMLMSVNEGNGALASTSFTWTKGIIIEPNDKTASSYEIVDLDGSTYMFFEWKSGDYTFRGMKPSYYVLKKLDDVDYSNYQCERRVDRIDYPFVDDPQVVGKWESIDFVRTIEVFNSEQKNWIGELYLKGLDFGKDGKLTYNLAKGNPSEGLSWTKGLVLCSLSPTASAYTIKEINGSTYMFYQWKNGDYVLRGMDPQYYVLKRK